MARIFGGPAYFGRIIKKTIGHILEDIVSDHHSLIHECQERSWDDRFEAAAVAQRMIKIGDEWAYTLKPAPNQAGWWVLSFRQVEKQAA